MTPLHSVKPHTYIEVKYVQFLPSCSCGWRAPTPTSNPRFALEAFERHAKLEQGRVPK